MTIPESPYAADLANIAANYVGERANLFRTMADAQRNGLTANEIHRAVGGAISRPIVLKHVAAVKIRDIAQVALDETELISGWFDVSYPENGSRTDRRAYLAITPFADEHGIDKAAFSARALEVLAAKGIAYETLESEDGPRDPAAALVEGYRLALSPLRYSD